MCVFMYVTCFFKQKPSDNKSYYKDVLVFEIMSVNCVCYDLLLVFSNRWSSTSVTQIFTKTDF